MPRTHDKSKIGHPKKRSRRAYSAEALSRYHAQLEDRWKKEMDELAKQFFKLQLLRLNCATIMTIEL